MSSASPIVEFLVIQLREEANKVIIKLFTCLTLANAPFYAQTLVHKIHDGLSISLFKPAS